MSARFQRRTFAAPFVVTLAGCMVQSAPPPRQPHPNPPGPTTVDPAPAPAPQPEQTTISNPPRPGTAVESVEAHWTVMKQGPKCVAYVKTSCPQGAMCNPPPPTDYACSPEITDNHPMKVVRWAGQAECQVEAEPMNCPPRASCNPPPPQRVACPK